LTTDANDPSASTEGPAARPEPTPSTSTPEASAPRVRSTPLGLGLLGVGVVAAFLLMSLDHALPHGPLWSFLAVLVAGAGTLELCGLLRALPQDVQVSKAFFEAEPGEIRLLSPGYAAPLAVAVLVVGLLAMPVPLAGVPITLSLLLLGLPALRRPGLFVFVAGSLLLLPMLGSYGLWDPWETHYGEVAREILARNDWITLWWAQDEWFRSKPVLIFWMEALAWGAMGMPFDPDTNPAHPEWAIRLPHYVLTMAALMSAYYALARSFRPRAAVLGSLVLVTTPYFYLLAHQAITDMPFVSTMTVAMAMFALAVEAGDDARSVRYRVGGLHLSAQSLVILLFVVVALPQAIYLVSRNLTLVTDDLGFWAHGDEFIFGSAGNSGIPGNPVHSTKGPYLAATYYQPFAQGLLWALGLFFVVRSLAKDNRTRSLTMMVFYLFCGLAWMAKGIPGFALPGLVVAIHLFVTGQAALLTSGKLRVGIGTLAFAITGLPWYVAMYGRLGPFFTDRLLIHDHINRLASGVHGDNGSIQYFLWQLGYGAFPWIGLFPAAFVLWKALQEDAESEAKARRTAVFLAIWAVAAFTLFNGMMTKFHHYIFPAVPPLSLLVGVAMDRALGKLDARGSNLTSIAMACAAPLLLVGGVGGLYGDLRGVVPEQVTGNAVATFVAENGPPLGTCLTLIALGLAGVVWAARRMPLPAPTSPAAARASAVFGAACIAGATLVALAGRDLSWATPEHPFGHERLIHLFVYNYGRPFPDYLDYRPILTGFAVVATLLVGAAGLARTRSAALVGLLATSFWFSAWALDVYLIDLSPHWGQRELVKRYYEDRDGAEALVAWQMNWKGENIYTGNRVSVFVQLDNKAVTKWMEERHGKRAYFLLEHSRLGNFKRMMGKRKVDELTTMRENNKFILVRAEL
jgi:4-amino-4-deoxy-L-arabinose transferase-like glycosyltransferase